MEPVPEAVAQPAHHAQCVGQRRQASGTRRRVGQPDSQAQILAAVGDQLRALADDYDRRALKGAAMPAVAA